MTGLAHGGLLTVLGVGILVYLWALRRTVRSAGGAVGADDDPVAAKISAHAQARRGQRHAWLAAIGVSALVAGLLSFAMPSSDGAGTGIPTGLVHLPHPLTASGIASSPTTSTTPATATTTTAAPPPDRGDTARPGMAPMLLATLAGTVLAIVGGALLVGFGQGRWSKVVGSGMVLTGLVSNFNVVKEVKFGDLFKVEVKAEAHVDKAALELEFGKRLQALSEFGPQPLGVVDDFESGLADLRPAMKAPIDRMCRAWADHGAARQPGMLLVIGSTDRVRLAGATSARYESNVGLARARAEQVKGRLVECDVPFGQIVTLVSGPRYTPADARMVPAESAARDRSVSVWALWSVPRADQAASRPNAAASGPVPR